ncbi:MAG TPA: ClbS/DfsB family four-helix bundle protein [Methylomirabilota bacterium]|nr:ClbS/DfsB family four-helix bundle protein [Methylomirabilota bacterium]
MSTVPVTKAELLSAAEHEYTLFQEALEGLDERRFDEVWLGVWCVKDIVAHISAWHRELAPALGRLARGERPIPEGVSYEDVDAWNAKFVAAKKAAPLPEVMRDLERSHTDFMRAAAAVPAARFEPGRTAWKIVDQNSAHHYKEHGDQIRAWRAEKGL